jgi:hypothetical protein
MGGFGRYGPTWEDSPGCEGSGTPMDGECGWRPRVRCAGNLLDENNNAPEGHPRYSRALKPD